MALLPWIDIPSTDRDAESVINEDFVDAMHNNQEVLGTQIVDCRWDEILENTTFPHVHSEEVFIPECCATTDTGDIVLVVRFQKKVASGTTGQVRITLGSGSAVSSATFTNTTYDTVEIEISSTDVRAVAGTIATLQIELLRSAGSGYVYAENVLSSSRVERRAA